jgi:hypothetical protein
MVDSHLITTAPSLKAMSEASVHCQGLMLAEDPLPLSGHVVTDGSTHKIQSS